jgi:hypothetical protein
MAGNGNGIDREERLGKLLDEEDREMTQYRALKDYPERVKRYDLLRREQGYERALKRERRARGL